LPPSRKTTDSNDNTAILTDRFTGRKNNSMLVLHVRDDAKKLTVASFAVFVYTSLWAVKWPQ
jgi:hypothetical protein